MAKTKSEKKSGAAMIRDLLERNANISMNDAVAEMKRQGRSITPQNFYQVRHEWKKKRGHVAATAVAQKRRAKKSNRRVIEEPVAPSLEVEMLRRENRRLKDIIMRFMLDE